MRARSIASGLAGTNYEDRVLHHQSGRFREMMNAGRLLDGRDWDALARHLFEHAKRTDHTLSAEECRAVCDAFGARPSSPPITQ